MLQQIEFYGGLTCHQVSATVLSQTKLKVISWTNEVLFRKTNTQLPKASVKKLTSPSPLHLLLLFVRWLGKIGEYRVVKKVHFSVVTTRLSFLGIDDSHPLSKPFDRLLNHHWVTCIDNPNLPQAQWKPFSTLSYSNIQCCIFITAEAKSLLESIT